MRRVKSIVMFIVLLVAAVMFIVLGVRNIKNQKSYTHTEGIITEISTKVVGDDNEHTVMVAYSVDGVDYESELGEYSSSMKVGKTIEICYDPEDPATIISAGAMGVIITFAAGVMAIFGAFAVMFGKRRR